MKDIKEILVSKATMQTQVYHSLDDYFCNPVWQNLYIGQTPLWLQPTEVG
jgi:hypothetical protein